MRVPGCSPKPTKVKPSLAASCVTRMSAAIAKQQPAPIAGPLMHAMTGTCSERMLKNRCQNNSHRTRHAEQVGAPCHAEQSGTFLHARSGLGGNEGRGMRILFTHPVEGKHDLRIGGRRVAPSLVEERHVATGREGAACSGDYERTKIGVQLQRRDRIGHRVAHGRRHCVQFVRIVEGEDGYGR